MRGLADFSVYQIENARRVSAAMNDYLCGKIDTIIDLCAEDIVWRSIAEPEHAPFGGTFHGRDGVRRFFSLMFGAFDITAPSVVDVICAGDEVIHILKLDAHKRDGSAAGAAYLVGRWRFRDGRAIAFTDYFNVGAAVQTSTLDSAALAVPVTQDPAFAVYRNENAVLLLDVLASYRGGGIEPLIDVLHPGIVWRTLADRRHAPFGGLYQGTAGVRDYFRRLGGVLTLDEYVVVDVIPAGEEVVHVADVHAHLASNPKRRVFVRLVCFWTIRDGRVTHLTEYFDVPAFFSQLGPSGLQDQGTGSGAAF